MRRVLCAGVSSMVLLAAVACDEVTPPAGDPVDLSYVPCVGASDSPSWVAFQDGDGSWQRLTATANGSYNFTLRSGKGGLASYTPGGLGLLFVYASTEEFKANLIACSGTIRSVTGTVTGYASLDNVTLWLGVSGTDVFGSSSPAPSAFAITDVDPTATDLLAVRHRTSSSSSVLIDVFPTSVFIRRNLTGSSTSAVDLSSTTEGGAPVQRTAAVTNLTVGEELSVVSLVGLKTTTGSIAAYRAASAVASGTATAPFYGVPASRLASGESQMLYLSADKSVSSNTLESRTITSVFSDPTDRSVTLGPALGTITVTGGARPTATYAVQSAYDNIFSVSFEQGNDASHRRTDIIASSAYFAGATSVTLSVPNLSGVSGFSSSWLMVPGVSSTWDFLATDADFSFLNFKVATYQRAERISTFTP
jgi:hypothetical protein